jgi:hypothetical protein
VNSTCTIDFEEKRNHSIRLVECRTSNNRSYTKRSPCVLQYRELQEMTCRDFLGSARASRPHPCTIVVNLCHSYGVTAAFVASVRQQPYISCDTLSVAPNSVTSHECADYPSLETAQMAFTDYLRMLEPSMIYRQIIGIGLDSGSGLVGSTHLAKRIEDHHQCRN